MLPVSVTTSMVAARPAQLPEPQWHHLLEATGGYFILYFLFFNKASFPIMWSDSLEAAAGRVAMPTAHHPAKTASSHAPLVAMLGWWAPSLPRDVQQKIPSQALLQWGGHNAQAQLFPDSLQHCQLTRQVGCPSRFSLQHPTSSSADPQLPGSSPCLRALKVTVNGSSLAKDKLFLQGMYSCTGQPEVPEVSLTLSATSTVLGSSLAGGLSLPALPDLRLSPPLACLFCPQRGSTPNVIPL